MTAPLNIHQRLAQAMRSVTYIQKERKAGMNVSATSRPYAVRLDGCMWRQGMRSSMRDLGCPSRMARRVSAR